MLLNPLIEIEKKEKEW